MVSTRGPRHFKIISVRTRVRIIHRFECVAIRVNIEVPKNDVDEGAHPTKNKGYAGGGRVIVY